MKSNFECGLLDGAINVVGDDWGETVLHNGTTALDAGGMQRRPASQTPTRLGKVVLSTAAPAVAPRGRSLASGAMPGMLHQPVTPVPEAAIAGVQSTEQAREILARSLQGRKGGTTEVPGMRFASSSATQ